MNEASWPGTRLMRMTSATHWRAEKSTVSPWASALIYPLLPGSGTYHSALLVCLALWKDAKQILIPWSLSSHWDNQSLHRSLLESLFELCTYSSIPFWEFSNNNTIKGSSVWTLFPLLKTLYCNNMVQSISHDFVE